MVPRSNVQNLMLKEEVAQAIADGKFHIWPVETIDEGIEVLMGTPAGAPTPAGEFPEGTVHHMVNRRIQELAECLRDFMPSETTGKAAENPS